jgi:hypothetical protein
LTKKHFKRPLSKIRIGDSENTILGLFQVRVFGNLILKSCKSIRHTKLSPSWRGFMIPVDFSSRKSYCGASAGERRLLTSRAFLVMSSGERGSLAVRHPHHPSRLSEGGQYSTLNRGRLELIFDSIKALQYCTNAHVSLRRRFSLTLSNCHRSQSPFVYVANRTTMRRWQPFLALVSHTSGTSFSEQRPSLFLALPCSTMPTSIS